MQTTTMTRDTRSERRNFKRIRTILSGSLSSGERMANGIVLDLSVSGAKVRMEQPTEPGVTVDMQIARLGEFKGEVMWRVRNMIGLRFLESPLEVSGLMAEIMPQECLAN